MSEKLLPNFVISHTGVVSNAFLERGINTFHQALKYIGELPYGRNNNRTECMLVLSENKGTCSTKHALLAQLCMEQDVRDIKLYTGIYDMNEENTPGVGGVLQQYGLNSIPEAHCYLKYQEGRFDFTRLSVKGEPIQEFLTELEIIPSQIGDDKVRFHRSYIPTWLKNKDLVHKLSVEKLWEIREECIKALSELNC
ncbi:hypothetical protein [Bacillus sp. AK128]